MEDGEIARYRDSRKAVERQRALRVFAAHLVAYIIGNMIIALWNAGTFYLRDNDTLWFWLPLLFWGIGIIAHYVLGVALFDDWWDRDERVVQQNLNQERDQ